MRISFYSGIDVPRSTQISKGYGVARSCGNYSEVDLTMPQFITLNGHNFAENITDMKYHKNQVEGYCRRYKNKIEIYNPDMSPLAVINRFGVLFGYSKDATGNKAYKFLFHDDPLYIRLGKNLQADLRKLAFGLKEHHINTIPEGGLFSAYPDHEYRFG